MKPCKLQNPVARKIVSHVCRHLRKNFPNDARILTIIVQGIKPFNKQEPTYGKTGRWNTIYLKYLDEARAWLEKVGGHGRWPGIIKLQDNDGLTIGTVAHELGHAFTSDDEIKSRCAPTYDWANEVAADMHAMRWGLLTCKDIQRRNINNTGSRRSKFHYDLPPGAECVIYGQPYRMTKDFIFERIETENQHSEDTMNQQQAAIARGMLTPQEAGARCGIPDTLIMSLARRKKIVAYRFGYRTIRFKPSDVDAYIEKMRI